MVLAKDLRGWIDGYAPNFIKFYVYLKKMYSLLLLLPHPYSLMWLGIDGRCMPRISRIGLRARLLIIIIIINIPLVSSLECVVEFTEVLKIQGSESWV